MFSTDVQVIFFFFFAMLFARGASSAEAPIPGYGVQDISWSVTHTPGADPQEFKGTVEQVFSKALEMNPNFYEDFGIDKNAVANNTAADHAAASAVGSDAVTDNAVNRYARGVMDKRDTWNCNPRPDWHSAYLNGIQQGISYLRGVPGQPSNGPGPGNCGRVSCSYQCAIWWCNDNDFTKVLPSFNNIADGAQLLVNECSTCDPISCAYKFVRGQDFHTDNWNVIVRLDDC